MEVVSCDVVPVFRLEKLTVWQLCDNGAGGNLLDDSGADVKFFCDVKAITGCLQLLKILEILEIYWNLKSLLEILGISWNLIAAPGNFCIIGR